MAYMPTTLIARRGYSGTAGLDDIWDKVKAGVSAAVDYYGSTEQAKGAAAATAAQNAALTQALTQKSSSGLSTTTMVAIGAVGLVGLALVLRRK
jgi:hypothetical protein